MLNKWLHLNCLAVKCRPLSSAIERRKTRRMKSVTFSGCDTLLFDAGNTLIYQQPSTISAIYTYLTENIDPKFEKVDAQAFIEASELWAGVQGDKESRGESRMPDGEFYLNMQFAGIHALKPKLPHVSKLKHAKAISQLLRKRDWVASDPVISILKKLKSRDYILGVVSNFTPELRNLLRDQGMDLFFDIIIISDEVGIWKPDPCIMLVALKHLQKSAEQCVYIGDHPFDFQCAKTAGIKAVWLNPNNSSIPKGVTTTPDYEIRSLEELLGLFCEDQTS